jgi:RNA polymerase primary sigma factor
MARHRKKKKYKKLKLPQFTPTDISSRGIDIGTFSHNVLDRDQEKHLFKYLQRSKRELLKSLCCNLYCAKLIVSYCSSPNKNEYQINEYGELDKGPLTVYQRKKMKLYSSMFDCVHKIEDIVANKILKNKKLIRNESDLKYIFKYIGLKLIELFNNFDVHVNVLERVLTDLINKCNILGDSELPLVVYSTKDLLTKIIDYAQKYLATYNHIKHIIVKYNMRLVKSIVRKALLTISDDGNIIDEDDLIQHGVIGLMIAIDRYDLESGNKLSTYATNWIRQKVQQYINENLYLPSIPAHIKADLSRLNKKILELGKENLTMDEKKELAKQLECDMDYLENLLVTRNKLKTLRFNKNSDSSKKRSNNNEELEVSNIIEDETASQPIDKLCDQDEYNRLMILIKKLPFKYQYVLLLSKQIIFDYSFTYQELAKIFMVTSERISQMIDKAVFLLKSGIQNKRKI